MRRIHALACSLALLGSTRAASATVFTPGFVETQILPPVGGNNFFTGMAWATDGSQRLFLAGKDGAVRVLKNGSLLPTPFSVDAVFTNSECGLIGIALDPNFAQTGYVYLFETVSSTEQRIVRYTASGDVGINKQTIVSGLPTRGANHDGGAIGFGPDGKLYWGIGDTGNLSGVNADLTTLASKIGRAERNGAVPGDNPFVDGPGPQNDYIWARGFRNPFTLTFQPGTGALWVNGVGTSYEQIFVVSAGSHAGYLAFENDQPAGFLTPTVVYQTNNSDVRNLLGGSSGAVRSGGVTTFTTSTAHGFRKGGKITISGVSDASFNGAGFVLATPSATSFTIAQAGSNTSSGGGTAATQNIGGAVTGGDFWSSSALPAEYRGNFFFGDYNSGALTRVAFDSDGSVRSVDGFAAASSSVDVATGPDGALYWLLIDGTVSRISPVAAAQGLVVSPLQLRLDEAGRAVVNVRLAQAPSTTVNVSAVVSGGSPDVSITSGAGLSFTPANWASPQAVTLQAASDLDAVEDSATLRFSSSGLASEDVGVRVTDLAGSSGRAAAVSTTAPRHVALLGFLLIGGGALLLSRRGARSRGSKPAAA